MGETYNAHRDRSATRPMPVQTMAEIASRPACTRESHAAIRDDDAAYFRCRFIGWQGRVMMRNCTECGSTIGRKYDVCPSCDDEGELIGDTVDASGERTDLVVPCIDCIKRGPEFEDEEPTQDFQQPDGTGRR